MTNQLQIGTEFQITKGYGKRTLTVTAISTTPNGFDCHDEKGDLFFFPDGAFEVHESVGTLRIVSQPETFGGLGMPPPEVIAEIEAQHYLWETLVPQPKDVTAMDWQGN